MLFVIHKTSDWREEVEVDAPALGAKKMLFSDANGQEHRYFWALEIPTLGGLVELWRECRHELILGHPCLFTGLPTIEIYDARRE